MPYSCQKPGCAKVFRDPYLLHQHLDVVHSNSVLVEYLGSSQVIVRNAEGFYRCPGCMTRYKAGGQIQQHTKYAHPRHHSNIESYPKNERTPAAPRQPRAMDSPIPDLSDAFVLSSSYYDGPHSRKRKRSLSEVAETVSNKLLRKIDDISDRVDLKLVKDSNHFDDLADHITQFQSHLPVFESVSATLRESVSTLNASVDAQETGYEAVLVELESTQGILQTMCGRQNVLASQMQELKWLLDDVKKGQKTSAPK